MWTEVRTVKCIALVGTALLALSGQLQANEKIGVSAAVKGDVYVRGAQEENQRRAIINEDVSLGDEVDSRKKSALQILLLDETVFTVGADCVLTIDEFVYDPSAGSGKMAASVAKGTFRYVTGLIGGNNPQDVSINTPTATIGIRGTIIETSVGPDAVEIARLAGLLGPDDEFDPEKATIIVLRGPGPNNNALNKDGSVDIEAGGKTQSLTMSATAVFIPYPGAEPTEPFLFTSEMDAFIGRWLRTRPVPSVLNMFDQNGTGRRGSDLSGQSTASGDGFGTTSPGSNGRPDGSNPEGEVFPRDDAEDFGDTMMTDGQGIGGAGDTGIFNNIGDEITTFELAATAGAEVTFFENDVKIYSDSGQVPFFNENGSINVVNGPFFDGDTPAGNYDFAVTVDPNSRTYTASFDVTMDVFEATGSLTADGSFGTGTAFIDPVLDPGVDLTLTGLCDGGNTFCDARVDLLKDGSNPLSGAAHMLIVEEDFGEGVDVYRGAGSTSDALPPLLVEPPS